MFAVFMEQICSWKSERS